MRRENGYSRSLRALLAVGVSLAALTASVGSLGETPEMDAYKAAIKSQSEADAIHFIRNFGSGDLVDDLIRSLRSNVAQQVCIDLRGGGSADVREACQAFPAAAVLAPTAPDLFTGEVDQITTVAPSAGPSPSGPAINEPLGGHDNGGNIILPPTSQTPSTSAQETSSQTSGAPSSGSTSDSTSASNGDSSDSSSSGGGAAGSDGSDSGATSGGSAAGSDSSGSGGDSGVSAGAGVSGGGISGGVSAGVGGGGVSAGGGVSGGGVGAGGGVSAGD